MTDYKFLLFGAICAVTLAYCLWKTHSDWERSGFTLAVIWGIVACLGAFLFIAFVFAASVFRNF